MILFTSRSRRTRFWILASAAVACALGATEVAGSRAVSKTGREPVAALFAYDAAEPLAFQDSLLRTFDKGVTLHEISFASPRGGRVHAYLVVPPGKTKFPVVVFGPWGLGNRTEFIPEANVYAQMGAVSIIVDWPWTRPVPDRRSQGPLEKPEEDAAVFEQAVVDLKRAVDVMVARPDVDASRIVYVGHSYGAQFGAILAAIDPRVRAAVLMAGIPDQATFLVESQDADVVDFRSKYTKKQIEHYLQVNASFDAVGWVGKISPRPVLMQFAEYERQYTRAAMERYAAAAKEPKIVYWYPTGHELNDPMAFLDRMVFVSAQLGLKGHEWLGLIPRPSK
jgi:dienelactone hydrolase